MTTTSTPDDGLPINELLRRRKEEQARIQEEVMQASLERQKKLALDFAKQLSDELVSTFNATEKKLLTIASRMKEELDREREETRRRIRHPWLPIMLGAALVLAIQAMADYGPAAARWVQERQVLSQVGAEVRTGEDGGRWISFPPGTEFVLGTKSTTSKTESTLFIRIPEG